MAAHEKQTARAERLALRSLQEIGRELRAGRLDHDLSQRVAASAAGMTQSTWSRIEGASVDGVPLVMVARALAVVGRDLHVRSYPSGAPLRDLAHVELLERLHRRCGPAVTWATEVPLPNPGDRRAWDALARVARVRIGIEAETRAYDSQELKRRLELKRRDGGVDHVVLLLGDTRHNRAFVRAAGHGFREGFPVPGRVFLERLAASADPGGSAIVLL